MQVCCCWAASERPWVTNQGLLSLKHMRSTAKLATMQLLTAD
jgi:hypothetical protein